MHATTEPVGFSAPSDAPGSARRQVAHEPISVSVLLVARIAGRYLRSRGLDAPALLHDAGLDGADPNDVDARVPIETERNVWRCAERATADGNVGLHAGAAATVADLDVLGQIIRASATLGDALAAVAQLHRLAVTGIHMSFERDSDSSRLTLRLPRVLVVGSRHAIECALGALVAVGRAESGSHWRPLTVRFQHLARADRAEASRFFGTKPSYGCERTELELRESDAARRMRNANPELLRVLERHAREVLERIPLEPPLVARVRRHLLEVLGHGEPTLQASAGYLAMSGRTLQRRLREHGTSYQAVLDGLRHELAFEYLARDDIDVAQIAFLLGFASPSAFFRAFRRWSGGRTPGELRRAGARGYVSGAERQ